MEANSCALRRLLKASWSCQCEDVGPKDSVPKRHYAAKRAGHQHQEAEAACSDRGVSIRIVKTTAGTKKTRELSTHISAPAAT